MSFKSSPCPDRWHALLALLLLALVGVILFQQLAAGPVDGLSFLFGLAIIADLLAIVFIGYRTFGAFTLEYWIDRDAVTLAWGATRQIVPMGQIQQIIRNPASQVEDRPALWHWPSGYRRRLVGSGLGPINAYAACPVAQQIILVTPRQKYGLSPADPDAFIEALQQRYALGVARPLQAELRRPPIWTWPLWRDRAALALIALGFVAVAIMFGALCFRYPHLSADLPLHFDVTGLPDRIAPKSGLFVLPIIGLVTWLVNTFAGVWLYRRAQQGSAYLLWGGALVVQGIAGLALFNLMRW